VKILKGPTREHGWKQRYLESLLEQCPMNGLFLQIPRSEFWNQNPSDFSPIRGRRIEVVLRAHDSPTMTCATSTSPAG
jgi:hypothetical protein